RNRRLLFERYDANLSHPARELRGGFDVFARLGRIRGGSPGVRDRQAEPRAAHRRARGLEPNHWESVFARLVGARLAVPRGLDRGAGRRAARRILLDSAFHPAQGVAFVVSEKAESGRTRSLARRLTRLACRLAPLACLLLLGMDAEIFR